MIKLLAGMVIVNIVLFSVAHSEENKIVFPKDYRTTFTNYLSLDRVQNPDQIIRLFANDIAMKGPGDDGKFPFGSILVGEVYTVKKNKDGSSITSTLNRRIKDKLVLVAIMQRDENFGNDQPEGLENGHWEFATFKPDGSVAQKDLNACRACHAPLVNMNHVFSYEHLVK